MTPLQELWIFVGISVAIASAVGSYTATTVTLKLKLGFLEKKMEEVDIKLRKLHKDIHNGLSDKLGRIHARLDHLPCDGRTCDVGHNPERRQDQNSELDK